MSIKLEYATEVTIIEQNGQDIHFLTYEIDALKPQCWVEGFEYKFNSRLVSRVTMTEKEMKNVKPDENYCRSTIGIGYR